MLNRELGFIGKHLAIDYAMALCLCWLPISPLFASASGGCSAYLLERESLKMLRERPQGWPKLVFRVLAAGGSAFIFALGSLLFFLIDFGDPQRYTWLNYVSDFFDLEMKRAEPFRGQFFTWAFIVAAFCHWLGSSLVFAMKVGKRAKDSEIMESWSAEELEEYLQHVESEDRGHLV